MYSQFKHVPRQRRKYELIINGGQRRHSFSRILILLDININGEMVLLDGLLFSVLCFLSFLLSAVLFIFIAS